MESVGHRLVVEGCRRASTMTKQASGSREVARENRRKMERIRRVKRRGGHAREKGY